MKKVYVKIMAFFLAMLLSLSFPQITVQAAQEEPFPIYVWLLDENGETFTGVISPGDVYEPGFTSFSTGDYMPRQVHAMTNQKGVATINQVAVSDNRYQYFAYGDKNGKYETQDSPALILTKPGTLVKVELALKDSGKQCRFTVIEPGSAEYPANPQNPEDKPIESKILYGRVCDVSGGVAGAKITAKHPVNGNIETAQTDAQGNYRMILEKDSFGTVWLTAEKDGQSIQTLAGGSRYSFTYEGTDFSKSYDFGVSASEPAAYPILVNNGVADQNIAAENTTVTITANTPPDGKIFKQWISSEVIFVNPKADTTTFIMPGKAVTITAEYEDIPTTVTKVTITPESIAIEKGKTVQFRAEIAGTGNISQDVKWSIVGSVSASNISENSGLLTVSSAETAPSFQIKAVSGTDSSRYSTAVVTVVTPPVKPPVPPTPIPPVKPPVPSKPIPPVKPPVPSKPIPPVKPPVSPKPSPAKPKKDNIINVSASIKISVNKKGAQKLTITDKNIKDLLKRADKKRQKTKNNIVNLEIKAKGVKTSKPFDYVFTKKALKVLTDKKVNSVNLNCDIANLNLDSKVFKDIRKQTSGDATLMVAKKSKQSLTKKLQKAVKNQPVYEINLKFQKKSRKKTITKQITTLKTGKIKVSVPYKLKRGEKAGRIKGAYLTDKGKVSYIRASKYITKKRVLEFTTNRLTKYGVANSK